MFDYLQKFNSLPRELRNQISSPAVMTALSELENKYRVDLAMVVMKVMIKDLPLKGLPAYLISEFDLAPSVAENLARELQDRVLASVASHLGFIAGKSVISAKSLNKIETVVVKPKADRLKNPILSPAVATVAKTISEPAPLVKSEPAPLAKPELASVVKPEAVHLAESSIQKQRSLDIEKDIDLLIKETGLILPSEAYVGRLKNILVTYLRGIRNKIDTRAALTKDVEIGGLRLSALEADRIFKVCDSRGCHLPENNGKITLRPAATSLDKIIEESDKAAKLNNPNNNQSEEYNLKSALASGQTKPIAALSQPELTAPKQQLDLPQPSQPAAPIKNPIPAPIKAPIPAAAPATAKPITTKPIANLAAKITPAPTKPTVAPAQPQIKPSPRPAVAPRPAPAPAPNKPQMHDIKPVPKVMGPIEELQFLDLTNFRRLGKTATEITAKIFAKIKLLEKDGYDRMVAGVHAWRLSPVNRLYISLGQEAIAKGITIKEAVAIRQKAGQPGLSMEEIEEIVKLNSRLAF